VIHGLNTLPRNYISLQFGSASLTSPPSTAPFLNSSSTVPGTTTLNRISGCSIESDWYKRREPVLVEPYKVRVGAGVREAREDRRRIEGVGYQRLRPVELRDLQARFGYLLDAVLLPSRVGVRTRPLSLPACLGLSMLLLHQSAHEPHPQHLQSRLLLQNTCPAE